LSGQSAVQLYNTYMNMSSWNSTTDKQTESDNYVYTQHFC